MVKKRYFKNVDGLRFFAALSVMAYHIAIRFKNETLDVLMDIISFHYNGGWIGVNFFFVLSGFLITYLMFVEKDKKGRINIWYFYIRRVLRIWPLYFLSLLIGFELYPSFVEWVYDTHYMERANPLLFATFLTNFDHIYNGLPTIPILGVQWSVAIEEQFYLPWPIVFFFFGKGRRFLIPLVILFVISTLWKVQGGLTFNNAYYNTISAFIELSMGAFIAYLSFYHIYIVKSVFSRINRFWSLIIYISGILWISFKMEIAHGSMRITILHEILSAAFFAFIIMEQCFSQRKLWNLANKAWISYFGKISYGIYLFHMIPIVLIMTLQPLFDLPVIIDVLMVIGITLGMSSLSYHFFEQPFLKLKDRFR